MRLGLRTARTFLSQGKDVIVVQAKVGRLGMYLMGQALFSKQLVERMGAKTVRSVALCGKDDAVMRPMLEAYDGVEVVVMDHNDVGAGVG